jgi:hypothetical protein
MHPLIWFIILLQIAKDRGVGEAGCNTGYVIHYYGHLHCDVEKIDFDSESNSGSSDPQLFNVDHVHPHEDAGAPVAILYGEPGKTGFGKVHKSLSQLAGKGKVKYVLRPFLNHRNKEKVIQSHL